MAESSGSGSTSSSSTKSSKAAAADEEARVSKDAQHSTYAEVAPPDDVTPAPGRTVEQTLGVPTEASD